MSIIQRGSQLFALHQGSVLGVWDGAEPKGQWRRRMRELIS